MGMARAPFETSATLRPARLICGLSSRRAQKSPKGQASTLIQLSHKSPQDFRMGLHSALRALQDRIELGHSQQHDASMGQRCLCLEICNPAERDDSGLLPVRLTLT